MARTSASALLLVLVTLAGCATAPPDRHEVVVFEQINASAARIEHQLTALDASRAPDVKAYPAPTSGPLASQITLSWSGPLEPAVQSVADLIGYHVRHTGRRPILPILVRIHAMHKTAFSILQNLGWQSGTRAGLVVVPSRHVIDIVYVARVHTAGHGK